MGNLRIEDLVDAQCIKDLETLNNEIQKLQKNYLEALNIISKAMNLKVDGVDDLEKMESLIDKGTKKANEATKQINDIAEKRNKKVEEASKKLAENVSKTESLNAKKREELKIDKDSLATARTILGSRDKNLKILVKLEKEIQENLKAQKELSEMEKKGTITTDEAVASRVVLIGKERELKTAKRELQKTLSIEERMSNAVAGGYAEASQKLELLKRAYKQLGNEAKSSPVGEKLAKDISKLDKALKDSAASMGEHQRNVGDYAIAANGKLSELLGISNKIGASILNMAQNGSLGFATLKTSVSAFFTTLMGFLANPAVLAVLGIGGTVAAFKWLYSYNKGLAEATKQTQQLTGANGNLLKSQRNNVQALSEQYGKDFRDVLISVNAVAQQFGISFDEAFEKVKIGFASGADANGEFIDNLKEYPAYFKEAGLSAGEFIAITTQTNKMGIYSDKAIDTIKEGNIKLREMTDATKKALEGIGMSSDQVQKDLESGSKSTFEILQEVSAKLAKFPESSAEVGAALADIFGSPGEDAGLQYIKILKDIETDQEKVKEKAGKLAELNLKQFDAQIKMQNALDTLFDFTGGSFEELTVKATTFVKKGITKIIKGVIKVANYFIRLYNDSRMFRALWQEIVLSFKNGFDFIGNLFNQFKSTVKATGDMLRGAFTFDWGLMKKGLKDFAQSYKALADVQIKDMKQNRKEADEAIDEKFKPIQMIGEANKKSDNGTGKETETNTTKGGGEGKELTEEEKAKIAQEAARQAEERMKIIEALNQSELDLMDEGFDKGMRLIEENHKKKLSEIKGHSAEENQLRQNLNELYLKKVAEYEDAYNETRAKTDLLNRLENVKEGSDEELSMRLELLSIEEKAELEAAEKTGADKLAIEEKYSQKRLELQESMAEKRLSLLSDEYATEETIASVNLSNELTELKKSYSEGIITKEEYERKKKDITERYAIEAAQKSVDLLEMQLDTENLSEEKREELTLRLMKAKAAAEATIADAMIGQTERQDQADKEAAEAREKRMEKLKKAAKEAYGAVDELVNSVFEAKITKLDEEQEANQAAMDAEIERIEHLEETGAISKEEAEARKQSAEAKTSEKEKEIEKQKQKLQHKQAVWNKANQIAQTIIATARGVMEALAIPFLGKAIAAMVAATGATQVATIIATPIPKYAKGTDFHEGGFAVVGDGGRREAVQIGGEYWITPDVPTLVNLPRGSQVLPDANEAMERGLFLEELDLVKSTRFGNPKSEVIVNNDFYELVRCFKNMETTIRKETSKQMKQQQSLASRRETDTYIAERM